MIPFTRDLAERAVKTFIQAFMSVFALAWAAAGLSVDQLGLDDVSIVGKILLAAAAAGGAAAISLVMNTVLKSWGQAGSASLVPAKQIIAVSPGIPTAVTPTLSAETSGYLEAYRAAQADAGVPGIESITPTDEPGEHRAPE
jgi:hypothetical protein